MRNVLLKIFFSANMCKWDWEKKVWQQGDHFWNHCRCIRDAEKSKWDMENVSGKREQTEEMFVKADITRTGNQNKHSQLLQSMMLPANWASCYRTVSRLPEIYVNTKRSRSPAKTKSAVYVLKEENQTPKRKINLSLTEAINSIQMWQRMKPRAMCLREIWYHWLTETRPSQETDYSIKILAHRAFRK